MSIADFRSDTVTKPTAAMRRAMAEAEVGDDVFGEDSTVLALEREVAERLGHEAGLFVPSGTMGNEIAVCVHTRPGDEIVLEATAHIYLYEGGAPAFLAGAQVLPLPGEAGLPSLDAVAGSIHSADPHYPRSRLLALENTHNRAGGRVLPLDAITRLTALAHERGLVTHLDGARLWNASVASGIAEAEYARHFDSVSVCFSKGLGAPIGSALVGSRALIDEARRVRKKLGGGMRQAGIIAAGALHALRHHRDRLREDHARAARLAQALSVLPGLDLDPTTVETNILVIGVTGREPDAWLAALKQEGVLAVGFGARAIRLVTHLDVGDADADRAITAFMKLAPALSRSS